MQENVIRIDFKIFLSISQEFLTPWLRKNLGKT